MYDFSAEGLAKAFADIAADGCERISVRVENGAIIAYEPVIGLHYHISGRDGDMSHSTYINASE